MTLVLWMWGTLVGLDLSAMGQFMIARPIVAGTVAGALVGDPLAGGATGAILELFALDVLPVGAVRYPDYGIAAVIAAMIGAHSPLVLGMGVAVAVGLVVAYMGEIGIGLVRSRTSSDVRRHAIGMDQGDWTVIGGVHRRGLFRNFVRSGFVTLVGLGLAWVFTTFNFVSVRGAVLVSTVVVGAGVGTAASGAMRLGGRGFGLRWFLLGLIVGTVAVVS